MVVLADSWRLNRNYSNKEKGNSRRGGTFCKSLEVKESLNLMESSKTKEMSISKGLYDHLWKLSLLLKRKILTPIDLNNKGPV